MRTWNTTADLFDQLGDFSVEYDLDGEPDLVGP